jgi:hypothetical protein
VPFGISLPLLLASGLTAYILSSWFLVLLRVIGITQFSPRMYWACGLFGSTQGAAMFAGRVLRAITMMLLIPLPYAAVFEIIGNAEFKHGAVLGLLHGMVIGFTLPLLGRRRGCERTPRPGLFGWRLGRATPLFILFVYTLYGAVLGYVYVVPSP